MSKDKVHQQNRPPTSLQTALLAVSQLNLLATKIGDQVFIDATMSMGLRNTCKLFEDFMKSFVTGLVHHHPGLFSDNIGTLVNNYLDDI